MVPRSRQKEENPHGVDWSALTTSTPPPIKPVFQDRKGTHKVCSLMALLEQEATNRALVRLEEGLGGGCRLRLRHGGFSNILDTFFFFLVFVAPPKAHPKECGGRPRLRNPGPKNVIASPFIYIESLTRK